MSYAALLAELDTALQNAGLTAAAEPRDGSLLSAGRGNFDGCYLLVNESGAQPWPDLAVNPSHWRGSMRLEVGTELKTSAQKQSETIEQRGRAAFEAIVYAAFSNGCIYEWDTPQVQRAPQDKRLVWTLRFRMRWTE